MSAVISVPVLRLVGQVYDVLQLNSLQFGTANDLILTRDAANTLAQRNGVSAQASRVYNTFTDASNGEWGTFGWGIFSANRLFVGSVANGTGSLRAVDFAGASFSFFPNGTGDSTTRWNLTVGGTLGPNADLTLKFGDYAANRPLVVSTGALAVGYTTQSGTTYTVATSDNGIVLTAATTVTLTLPAAASFTGRILRLKTTGGGSVISASSNVVPKAGGAAGTAILAATAGTWAELQSDGANWIVMAGT